MLHIVLRIFFVFFIYCTFNLERLWKSLFAILRRCDYESIPLVKIHQRVITLCKLTSVTCNDFIFFFFKMLDTNSILCGIYTFHTFVCMICATVESDVFATVNQVELEYTFKTLWGTLRCFVSFERVIIICYTISKWDNESGAKYVYHV